jgi:hypothetical protein
MIKFIFVLSDGSSGLAHDPLHRVIGLTLPPIDANPLFIKSCSLSEALKKNIWIVRCAAVSISCNTQTRR